ncbi:hypothetical protein, partial [Flavobacterium sp. HJSW_4]|uniref:hypothetical protein n=1 Tax=Flavobacterium sp. HJSW_4 TaxID=3344660 RepID=UPI0035F266CE
MNCTMRRLFSGKGFLREKGGCGFPQKDGAPVVNAGFGTFEVPFIKEANPKRDIKQKTPSDLDGVFQKKGDDILSHITAVPSAQAGLTSL